MILIVKLVDEYLKILYILSKIICDEKASIVFVSELWEKTSSTATIN